MTPTPRVPIEPSGEDIKPSHSRLARLHPHVYLGVYGIVGLAVAAASTWAFLAIADEFPEQGWLSRLDNGVTNWLQVHGTESGETIFYIVSLFGAPILTALLIGVAIWLARRHDWRRVALLAITCGGGALLNVVLKLSFHRARPSYAVEFNARSWSFPSGHAMDSLIAYGLLAYWLADAWPRRRMLIALAAIALVGVIGFARIYLGVHYLSDVLAGYSAGLVWLAVCVTGFRFAERRGVGKGPSRAMHTT